MSNTQNHHTQLSSKETIMSLIMGGAVTQFIGTAVKLGIPDVLKEGPMTSADVAQKCQTRQEETYRFLRGLSAIGLLEERENKVFSLSAVGEWLRSDIPGSFQPLAVVNSSEWNNNTYLNLDHTIKTGESAFQKTYGCDMFEWLTQNPEVGDLFGRAMSTYSGMEVSMVTDSYDFLGSQCIVDIGGSHGVLLCAILDKTPAAKGILLDTPKMIAGAKSRVCESFSSRLKFHSGDFFKSVPRGGDIYLLKHILHDWDDERCTQILQNIVDAMTPGGKILVIEQGITPPGIPGPGKMLDLSMMTLTEGGMERTPKQHQALFESVGLRHSNTIHTQGPISIFEATYL